MTWGVGIQLRIMTYTQKTNKSPTAATDNQGKQLSEEVER